ncbi:MAG: catalase [Thermoleophilaceae bacterium]|jgi:catalase|nr:catalase [Thermoleophilaceae bacterium]
MDPLAEEVVDAINDISGRHEGHRAAHAKGTLLAGTFTGSGSGLTTAAHMGEGSVRVTARFSNGGGDPAIPDYAKEGRGLAVKFYLPDGSKTDIVALSVPCFFARTPEDFLEFTRARKPDPETGRPDLEKVGAWLQDHPEAGPAIQAALSADPPESYATVTYNSIHSFLWTDPDGVERWVRYRFEPEAGERTLSAEEARALGRDYLQEEIARREVAAFTLFVVIADDDDPVNDPTVEWPPERRRVEVGRLELTGLETERERGGDILVFDPTRVTDGIALSDDPILHFRPRAYSASVTRRTGAPAPA